MAIKQLVTTEQDSETVLGVTNTTDSNVSFFVF